MQTTDLLTAMKKAGLTANGGDYENYLMFYDNEITYLQAEKFAAEHGLNLFYGFEEGGFNGGTFVLYKDVSKLPLYIKEAIENKEIAPSILETEYER